MLYLVVSYPKVVKFPLDKYASNETIIQTQDAIKNIPQLTNQRTLDFTDYICSQTNRCGSAYRPTNKLEIIIHSIAHRVSEQNPLY